MILGLFSAQSQLQPRPAQVSSESTRFGSLQLIPRVSHSYLCLQALSVNGLNSCSTAFLPSMELQHLAQTLDATFKEGKTGVEWRINQLKTLKKALEQNQASVRSNACQLDTLLLHSEE